MTKIITIDIKRIKQADGLYCLNDLHKASGGANKHRPAYFMARAKTKALVSAIEQNYDDGIPLAKNAVIIIMGKGKSQGTYVCRELVYAYAMWISTDFYLSVIRVFDVFNTGTLSQQINALYMAKDDMTRALAQAGRILCIGGKQIKPAIEHQLGQLLN